MIRLDPDFSEEALCSRVGEIYIQMQQAWQSKQWQPMRAVMTDALYKWFGDKLQRYIDDKQTNHVNDISILSTELKRFVQNDKKQSLTMLLKTSIIDYVTDDLTVSS